MTKIQYTLRIEETIFEKLKAVAQVEMRSVNGQFEYFIQECLINCEKTNGEIAIDE